jgi:hypothetical protein
MHWASDRIYGAAVGAYVEMAKEFGYTLVYVEAGLDVFLVRSDLLSCVDVLPLGAFEQILPHHAIRDPARKDILVDYVAWRETQNMAYASKASNILLRAMKIDV